MSVSSGERELLVEPRGRPALLFFEAGIYLVRVKLIAGERRGELPVREPLVGCPELPVVLTHALEKVAMTSHTSSPVPEMEALRPTGPSMNTTPGTRRLLTASRSRDAATSENFAPRSLIYRSISSNAGLKSGKAGCEHSEQAKLRWGGLLFSSVSLPRPPRYRFPEARVSLACDPVATLLAPRDDAPTCGGR